MASLQCRVRQPLRWIARPLLRHETVAQNARQRSISTLSDRVQIYRSPFHDPYLNLSIEHHLLQKSHPDSTVLFLYVNTPCVVVGRNQNPWLEVNLRALRAGIPAQTAGDSALSAETGPVPLVRRRSGGGTVFHDRGNVNWTVICPPAVFDRDRHAEMVVRALGRLGVQGVRVNERHDIVQDVQRSDGRSSTFKVSGSAYKLTRLRSLHHGTCLLSSPNLGRIGSLLRSPAEPYIKARGVESVRSPVRNVGVDIQGFNDAVIEEFGAMYGEVDLSGADDAVAELSEEENVKKGLAELHSPDWIYGQTPQFTFSTCPTEADERERPPMPLDIPSKFRASLTIRHGQILEASVSGLVYGEDVESMSHDQTLSGALVNQTIYHIADWEEVLKAASPVHVEVGATGRWLNELFGAQPGSK
ncbi:hypothetical protein GQ53DRAFT_433550 [Thozetella sp. PMI_491]|nr:hypothetical protein GQ53DRAFT_433550 [Thozetella sp. PMI_491]